MDSKPKEDKSAVFEFIMENHPKVQTMSSNNLTLCLSKNQPYNPLLNETLSHREDSSRPYQEIFRRNSCLQTEHLNRLDSNHPNHLENTSKELENLKDYIYVRFKRKLEVIDLYQDKFPFLEFRKSLLVIVYSISELSLRIVKSRFFEVIVILVIMMNTIVLAFEDPNSNINQNFEGIELFFILFYTVECFMKILAFGFIFSKESYLRDKWNVLDFVIIVTAWVSMYGGSNVQLNALRMFRILRPLRSISSIKGIRALFLALFKSIKHLFSALVVLFFFLFIFAIAGLQLWSGTLKKKCMSMEDGTYVSGIPCGIDACSGVNECVTSLDNPNYGTVNFDNIFISIIMVFQILTLEGWTQILEWNQRSFSYLCILFYIPLIFLGSYLIMNLSLAIITSSFTKAVEKTNHEASHNFNLDYLDEEHELTEKPFIKHSKQNPSEEFLLNDDKPKAIDIETQKRLQKLRPKSIINIKRPAILHSGSIEIEKSLSNDWNNSSLRMSIESDRQLCDFSPISSRSVQMSMEFPDSKGRSMKMVPEEVGLIKTFPSAMELSHKSSDYESPMTKSTIRRIKSILSLKTDSLGQMSTKIDKHFTLGIHDNYILKSSSSHDISIESSFIKYNHSYSFVYVNEDVELVNKKTLEKYSEFNDHQLKFMLKNKYGGKKAFDDYYMQVRKYIKDMQRQDTFDMAIHGQWSGNDVSSNSYSEHYLMLQNLNFVIWRKRNIEIPMFLLRKILQNKITVNLVTLAVIFNTIVLSTDHHGISASQSDLLTKMNTFFTYFFALELFLRLLSLGIREFLRDQMNFFDTIVVVLSLIELSILSGSTSAFSAFRAIRVFRIFRVLRVVRLLRYLKSISKIIQAIGKSISHFLYLFSLLILFLIIFSLLGMKIFGGQFNFDEGTPRANFDSFHWAFVTTFQVLSTENWNDILTSVLRSSVGIPGSLFLIVWVILGNFIFLNLFLAILIESFSQDQEDEVGEVSTAYEKVMAIAKKRFSKDLRRLEEFESLNTSIMESFGGQKTENPESNFVIYDDIKCEKSFYLFSKTSWFRKICFLAISNPKFDTVTLVLIVINSVKLVWDTYLLEMNSEDIEKKVSTYFDYIFTVIFSIEFILKSVSLGFAFSANSYLKDNWNKVDFLIIVFSIIDSSIESVNIPIIKVFRLLRCLRPLKLISHNISMKIVVIALVESIGAILNVLVVIILIWLVFAILGVSLLGGKMYSCSNSSIDRQALCQSSGYEWRNQNANFDNVVEAMSTLFIVMSQESWPNRMFEGVDARDVGWSPKKNSNPPMAYFYICYYIIGNFFLVNLFTAVVFDKFTQAKRDQSTMAALLLTKEQMTWSELQKMVLASKVFVEPSVVPHDVVRGFLFKVIKNRKFEIGMMVVILLNMVLMALTYEGASIEYENVLENINIALTFVFFLEALVKIIALGGKHYFKNNWNKFDFFVVITSAADFIIQISLGTKVKFLRSFPQLIRVLRVLRIGRVLRIVKSLRSLQNIIMTITYALPALLNILSLMILILFIFSVLGSFLFHTVKNGNVISDYFNFSNFGFSMIILWRISTGEDYPNIMYDVSNALGSKVYYIYFIFFITIIDFIIIELFVSVIIQNYEEQAENQESPLQIFTSQQKRFRKIWSFYSIQHSGYRLDKENLIDFLSEYGPKVDLIRPNPTRIELILLINSLDIKNVGDFYYYHDVFFSILKRKYGKTKKQKLPNQISLTLIRIDELRTSKRLARLRERSMNEFNDRIVKMNQRDNFFFKIMLTRSVFRSWKKYVKERKNRGSEISITPRFSEYEYPGENSLNSFGSSNSPSST